MEKVKKINIAVLTEVINNHSGAKTPLEIAKHLSLLHNHVFIYAYNFLLDEVTKKELMKTGVKFVIVTPPRIPYLGKYLIIFHLIKQLKKNHIHICLFAGTLPFFIATLISRIPILKIYQGTQFDALLEYNLPDQKINFFRFCINFLANICIYISEFISVRFSNQIVAISQYASYEGYKLYRKNSIVIYNGVGYNHKISKTKPYRKQIEILSVSRITPYKGFHQLIKILNGIGLSNKFRFTIVGSQPKMTYLNYLRNLSRFNMRIIIDASDKQLKNIYTNSDIYISADKYLFFGLPIVEAAYHALPTVSMDYAAAKEVIKHRLTGYVVINEYQFTKYLRLLMNSKYLRNRLGNQAKIYVNRFSWLEASKKYYEIMKAMI